MSRQQALAKSWTPRYQFGCAEGAEPYDLIEPLVFCEVRANHEINSFKILTYLLGLTEAGEGDLRLIPRD